MRGKHFSRWGFLFLALVFFTADISSAEEAQQELSQDLSKLSTAELVKRALAISKQLEPGLTGQNEDWAGLKGENATLRADLQTTRDELGRVQAELTKRSNDSTASADELSEARAALKKISNAVGSSSTSWKSSIDAVDKALKDSAMKQRRAEVSSWVLGSVAVATTIWAVTETALRMAGR